MQPHVFFLKHLAMTHAVEHQPKPAFKVRLGDIRIRNVEQPPKPPGHQWSKQEDDPGKEDDMDTSQEMDKGKIPLIIEVFQPEFFVPGKISAGQILRVSNGA